MLILEIREITYKKIMFYFVMSILTIISKIVTYPSLLFSLDYIQSWIHLEERKRVKLKKNARKKGQSIEKKLRRKQPSHFFCKKSDLKSPKNLNQPFIETAVHPCQHNSIYFIFNIPSFFGWENRCPRWSLKHLCFKSVWFKGSRANLDEAPNITENNNPFHFQCICR